MSRYQYHPGPPYNVPPPACHPNRHPFNNHPLPHQQPFYPQQPQQGFPQQQGFLSQQHYLQQQCFPIQQQHLHQQHLYQQQQQQQQQQHPRSPPYNRTEQAPLCYGSTPGSGWPASGSSSICSQPRDNQVPSPSASQLSAVHPSTQPRTPHPISHAGYHTAGSRRGSKENDIPCSSNNSFSTTSSGRGRGRNRHTSGELLPQQGRGDGPPGIQSSAQRTQDPSASSCALLGQDGGETSHQALSGTSSPPVQDREAVRGQGIRHQPLQKQQQQHHQQQMRCNKKTSQQKEQQRQRRAEGKAVPTSPRKETSPKSPEVAEPNGKKCEGKRAKRGKKRTSEKEEQREKMLDHAKSKFPDLQRLPYTVPPVRIHEKLKCTRLEERSVRNHDVMKQCDIQPATLLGYQTEDTVTQWLAKIISSLDEPVFFLSNYQFDDYLQYIRSKPKVKAGGNTTTTTKDDHNAQSSELKTDSSQGASNESENATRNSTEHENDCATASSGRTMPAAEPSPASCLFPTPDDLETKLKRGDFDNLIVIPRYGFIVVESKTMLGIEYSETQPGGSREAGDAVDDSVAGQAEAEAGARHREAQEADFRSTIKKALLQLQKEEAVLRHLTSDLVDNVPVFMLLAFPNTSAADLRRLLADRKLLEECRNTFGTQTLEEALSRCITSEHITSSQSSEVLADAVAREATGESLSSGQQWWRALIADLARNSRDERAGSMEPSADDSGEADGGTSAALSPEVFKEIVARFCGPYSRVPGRTVSDCVHLTGVLYERSILRSDQLDFLESNEPFLFLIGPPGSGKTLVLSLKAAEWAKQGDQIVVVCGKGVNYGSLVSWTLYDRIVYFMRCWKLRERKKAKAAADAAAAAAAACNDEGGADGDGDDAGTAKTPENKTNSLKKQARKKKYPAKLKSRADRLSSSECAGGPDKTAAEPGVHPQEDAGGYGGHHEQLSDGSVEPQSPTDQVRAHDSLELDDITVDNVRLTCISADTNVEEFVSELLDKYGKGNLRIIFDESPKIHKESYMPDTLTLARNPLNEMVGTYETMLATFRSRIEQFYRNDGNPRERPRSEPCEKQSQQHKQQAEDETSCERGTANKHTENDTDSKLKPSLEGQEDANQANKKGGKRSAERPHLQEEAGEKSGIEEGSSDEHAGNAANSHPKPSSEVNKDASQIEVEKSASLSSKQFKADVYFATMEDRMTKLGNRFKLVSAAVSSLNAEWSETVNGMIETYRKVKFLSEHAAGLVRGTPECCTAEDEDTLEKLSELVVNVMGFMFGVYNALNVFKFHHCLSVITAARESRASSLSPRQDALQAHSASPKVQNASQMQSTSLTDEVSEEESPMPVASVLQKETLAQTETVPHAENMSDAETALQTENLSHPPDLSVWATTVYPEYVPRGFTEGTLTESLRCTPNVQKILKLTEADIRTEVPPKYKYITHACDVNPPLPSDGPPVKWFDHSSHSEVCKEVNDCPECGEALVNYLVNTLGLRTTAEAVEKTRGRRGKKKQDDESQLYIHDVILSGSPIHQPDCAFIQKIRNLGIKVLYESQELTSPPPYEDAILVIGGSAVQGLEAKILVYLPELKRIKDEEKSAFATASTLAAEEEGEQYSEEDRAVRDKLIRIGTWNREYIWHVASRSLSHLIIFH